jgi:hypothetical protein
MAIATATPGSMRGMMMSSPIGPNAETKFCKPQPL